MANSAIMDAIAGLWSEQDSTGRRILDLACGRGTTTRLLTDLGYCVTATDYRIPPPLPAGVDRVAGVDLNHFLPFQSGVFDAVDLVEVIEHIENQPQLVREIYRVLHPGGRVLISTPNILNVVSRLRFLFTGFLRGRVRPVHYTSKPGRAPNIYLLHFYELYYLLFHYGFEIEKLRCTRVKFAARIFCWLFFPWIRLASFIAIIRAEKDPVQRNYNRQILSYLLDPALLLSDNIVVLARKLPDREDRLSA